MDAYSQTLDWIYNLRGGAIDLRLDRMSEALALFDHPERRFPALHIAGTNGKGSTAAILHRILTLAGYRTGLYTSPHLVSFTERIRVDDEEISPGEVVELAGEIRERMTAAGLSLTFFEIVTVIAFVYFARRRIDVGVIEVGLGGRLDATNLVSPLVSLITTISKDHEAYLGSDLLSIAREKAGIIKPQAPVVCGALEPKVAALIKQLAEERQAPAYFLGRDFRFFLKEERYFDYKGIKLQMDDVALALLGRHQRANAAVALAALELASGSLPVGEAVIREGLQSVAWPGRFEVMCQHPWVILDGAHNGEGVSALAEALTDLCRGRKIKLLFAAMADKDWRQMLSVLIPLVDEIILTKVQIERSAEPEQIASCVAGAVRHRIIEEASHGLDLLFQEAARDDVILVAGSLYLLGEVRPAVQRLVARQL